MLKDTNKRARETSDRNSKETDMPREMRYEQFYRRLDGKALYSVRRIVSEGEAEGLLEKLIEEGDREAAWNRAIKAVGKFSTRNLPDDGDGHVRGPDGRMERGWWGCCWWLILGSLSLAERQENEQLLAALREEHAGREEALVEDWVPPHRTGTMEGVSDSSHVPAVDTIIRE